MGNVALTVKKYHPNEIRISELAEHGTQMMVWMEPEHMRKTVKMWTKHLEHPDRTESTSVANDDGAMTSSTLYQELLKARLCHRQDFNSDPTGFWDYEKNNEPGRKGICRLNIFSLYKFWG